MATDRFSSHHHAKKGAYGSGLQLVSQNSAYHCHHLTGRYQRPVPPWNQSCVTEVIFHTQTLPSTMHKSLEWPAISFAQLGRTHLICSASKALSMPASTIGAASIIKSMRHYILMTAPLDLRFAVWLLEGEPSPFSIFSHPVKGTRDHYLGIFDIQVR